jgi:hypothetical protein
MLTPRQAVKGMSANDTCQASISLTMMAAQEQWLRFWRAIRFETNLSADWWGKEYAAGEGDRCKIDGEVTYTSGRMSITQIRLRLRCSLQKYCKFSEQITQLYARKAVLLNASLGGAGQASLAREMVRPVRTDSPHHLPLVLPLLLPARHLHNYDVSTFLHQLDHCTVAIP